MAAERMIGIGFHLGFATYGFPFNPRYDPQEVYQKLSEFFLLIR